MKAGGHYGCDLVIDISVRNYCESLSKYNTSVFLHIFDVEWHYMAVEKEEDEKMIITIISEYLTAQYDNNNNNKSCHVPDVHASLTL